MLRLWTSPTIEVDGEGPLPAGIDGEAALLDPPLRFATRPAALRVRVSTKHPGSSPAAALPDNAWGEMRALLRIAFTGSA